MSETDEEDFVELKTAATRALEDYADLRVQALAPTSFYASGRPAVYGIRRDAIRSLRELADWIDRWGAL